MIDALMQSYNQCNIIFQITLSSVGGLTDNIKCLRDMVFMPIMCPEILKNFNMTPPRGVLFYGPPGL